jgi:DNA-binding LacI/PurR family transcriptional regulator
MGQEATAMLLGLIAGEEVAAPHLTLATSLVVRASTAPPERSA